MHTQCCDTRRLSNFERWVGWCLCNVVMVVALGVSACGAHPFMPGQVTVRPTWSCMGINWHFRGDPPEGASVGVEFRRQGTDGWRPALPLWLHDFEDTTMFSGSVFRLAAGTDYEFKLTLVSADGKTIGRTITATTLTYPQMPAQTVSVPKGGLVEAQKLAKPGTVMLLAAGTYPGATLTKSGKDGEPIVYRPAGDGEVVIEGRVRIEADYIWLHGLTIRNKEAGIEGQSKGVSITACRVSAHYAIHPVESENYFIADNVLVGDSGGKFSFSGEGVDFGSDSGLCGHAVCFNDISDFADAVSYGRGNIDVYNNYIHENVDDFIEPDYSRENYRLWNNRCYNSMCGFSFQPMKGGPWYIFGNLNVGTYLHPFKAKIITGSSVIYGNTILNKASGRSSLRTFLRGQILNNVWVQTTGETLTRGGAFEPGTPPTLIDYNAYGTTSAEPFSEIDYRQRADQYDWDAHSVRVDYRKIFAKPVKVPAGEPYYRRDLPGKQLPKDWQFEHVLLEPRDGSKLIDAGTVLANLTGPYLDDAPDLGAQELGLGTPWYGPRRWDDQAGLVYGVPDGWRKVSLDQAGQYASIGCSDAKGARVLLARQSPRAFALMRVEPARTEARWTRIGQLVADDKGAVTKVLRFQDGLVVRLYASGENARLVAARVEPTGVLHVVIGCRVEDLAELRSEMFQIARSLYR